MKISSMINNHILSIKTPKNIQSIAKEASDIQSNLNSNDTTKIAQLRELISNGDREINYTNIADRIIQYNL